VESVKRKKWEKKEEEIVSTRRVPEHMSMSLPSSVSLRII